MTLPYTGRHRLTVVFAPATLTPMRSKSTFPCLARLMGRTRFIAAFSSNRRGSAAVEFAILVPLFLGLVFMLCQVGLYFYFSSRLNYATTQATRQIMTGSIANQGLTAAQFRTNVLCPLLPSNMSCSSVITNIQVVPDTSSGASYWYNLTNYQTSNNALGYTLSSLQTPTMNNNNTSFCIGGGGSYVAVQVYYAMPVLGIPQMLGSGTFNGQSVIFISATQAFRNEPFVTNYTGC